MRCFSLPPLMPWPVPSDILPIIDKSCVLNFLPVYNNKKWLDYSVYKNHGTIHGATWTNGKFGKALEFDGVDDYVNCGNDDSLNITDAITIELWTKIDDASSDIAPNQYWVSRGTGAYYDAENNTYLFYIANAGSDPTGYKDYIIFSLSNGSTFYHTYLSDELSMNAFDPNKWYHLVATWDGTTMKIYKNGVHISDADRSFSGSINSLSANLNIGRHTDGTRYFDGKIDELRIYNRALTPEEVKRLFEWSKLRHFL